MNDILDDQFSNIKQGNPNQNPKTRHGCVTTWLTLMFVGNIFSTISTLILTTISSSDRVSGASSDFLLVIFGIFGLINVVFVVMLFQWKKLGFYGIAGSSVLVFFINLLMSVSPMQSFGGIIGVGLLYGILQIRNDYGQSAWENLE